ncbi:hypothetical protein [Cohnella sp. 56]|uniref:hypothetical protein n=1 Tax=Cohnella sp. 56 TaxID=3113722 RepID=UPI0030E9FE33
MAFGGRIRLRLRLRRSGSAPGAVSVYLAAVMAAMIFLTGVLIDLGRIAAYRKQAELAVKAGARAVLSAYDPVLYERYGLFAIGGGVSEELVSEVLAGHAEPQDSEALRLLDTSWSETEVLESRPLGMYDIFKRQVLEEMKYKAPIDLTLDLASRFKGLPAVMKEARRTADLLEAMREAYDRREAALDSALKHQTEAGEAYADRLQGIVPQPPDPMSGSRSAGDVRDTADAAMMYGDYAAKRAQDAARAEAQRQREEERRRLEAESKKKGTPLPTLPPYEGPQYGAQIAAYEQGVTRLSPKLRDRAGQGDRAKETGIEAAMSALEEAEAANREMAAIAGEAAAAAERSAEWPPETGEGAMNGGEAQSLRGLRQTAAELVLPDSYWPRYRDELTAMRAEGEGLLTAANAFADLLPGVPGSTGMGETLRGGADRLQSLLAAYSGKYAAGGSVTGARRDALRSQRAADEERRALEAQSNSAWSGAMAFLGTLTGLRASPEAKQAFERVERLAADNMAWNKEQEEAEQTSAGNKPPSRASEGRERAMASADGWLDALSDGVTGLRDSVYFAEYSYARFSMAEPSAVNRMLNGGEDEGLLMPHAQENEYILYGLANPAANISAAYAEVFALRLAIRTMEGLIECRSYGHPLVVLAAATLYGITEAVKDMRNLLDRGVIQLSKYAKIDTFYKDYIRLFLLLHGGSAAQTTRRIALIEDELNVNLQEAYTYASVRGVSSLRLWFLPGAAKLAGKSVSWHGTVKGNRYETTYASDSAYQ